MNLVKSNLTHILLEGLNVYSISVLIKTRVEFNKVEIYNQIRALKGVVVVNIEKNNFLDRQKTQKEEYSLLHIKYLVGQEPTEAIENIKVDALKTTRIPGLSQFIPRPATIQKRNNY